jgi:hypothetical protein
MCEYHDMCLILCGTEIAGAETFGYHYLPPLVRDISPPFHFPRRASFFHPPHHYIISISSSSRLITVSDLLVISTKAHLVSLYKAPRDKRWTGSLDDLLPISRSSQLEQICHIQSITSALLLYNLSSTLSST